MADLYLSLVNQYEDQELKEQGCSGLLHNSRDDDTGSGKRKHKEVHEEENRHVLQKISPFKASIVGTSAMCGFEKAISIEFVDPVQEQSKVEKLSKYEVFLNHRGLDTKNTFVSHLDAVLRNVGREPFLDAKSLMKGYHAFKSINEAISGVYCHVAIFSPRYAESKYCLNELCDMLANKKPIIPVFYDVELEHLRGLEEEKEPFTKAFDWHMKRGQDEYVMKWKRALQEVVDLTGFRLDDYDK